jgi:hypothetical protein
MASGKKGAKKRLSGHWDDNVSNPHTTPSSVLKSPRNCRLEEEVSTGLGETLIVR